ncbi:TauD/TfdA family dioxygenase [Candidatus Thiosymbion oneisti]|uniref:TauD/TfdA family dioxygenase n=1 Tax=Candidatus Thiosymbion oneisti TaxID=589554 RepID=UPI000AF9E95E|nr:TauD/TfdA family dioxygenase [Candidatus Thiosymbion oneisti]
MTSPGADVDTYPFDLDRPQDYALWRERKLSEYPARLEDLIVEVRNPHQLTPAEAEALRARCRRANMAVYASPTGDDPDKALPRRLGTQLGLLRPDHNLGADQDAISALTVRSDALHRGYIPYSNRPIAWHTDGYYNPPDHRIFGMLLHCVRPAATGGENSLLDHEIAYILLRDRNLEFVRALMHPQAMTIPANKVNGKALRPDCPGPVFSVHPAGHLHMRYTDRTRSIHWRDDPLTTEAVSCLKEILHGRTAWHLSARLEAGWGLVTNNTLHTRTGFEDGECPRLLYRARYYDRISDT